MTEQQKLLHQVQMLTFAVIDASLFLDTHPDSRQALTYFRKQQAALKQAKTDYENKYGPLMIASQSDNEMWDWIDGPWPWEGKV